jgi:hypothetical protein
MNITWNGGTFFNLSTQKDKNSNNIDIAIEPVNSKNKENIILLKSDKVTNGQLKAGTKPFLISGPGEYEIGGVFVQSIDTQTKKPFYLIESEEITVCYISSLKQEDVNLELNNIDILIIDINGSSSDRAKDVAKIVAQVEPKIVIPMGYNNSKQLDEFLKVMGIGKQEETPKLNIKNKDLSSREGVEVVILSSKK